MREREEEKAIDLGTREGVGEVGERQRNGRGG